MPDGTEHGSDLDLLADLIGRARRQGADAADALVVRSAGLSHTQRLGEIEELQREESQDLGLRVLLGRRQAVVSSNDFGPAALDELVGRALAMARTVPEDPYCGLADAGQLAAAPPELDICDDHSGSEAELVERARACEAAALAVDGVTNSEGASASWSRSTVALAASNGFAGSYAVSHSSVAASVIAGEGTAMETDYDYHSTVFAADLRDPEAIGRAAGERTVARLNPRRVETGAMPVVFDPRIAGGLVRHLLSGINGQAIARDTSFLKDRLGEQVFARGITIVDDPHVRRGLRSKPFDAEGVANAARPVVKDGVLETWVLDLATARQLGLTTTGHAARGTSGPPSPSATNVRLEPGNVSRADLLGGVERGLYVTGMMGMGVNGVTGDYSRGANGFWIENGELAYPVSELTVAGNLKDMFLNMTAADDLEIRYGIDAPTLRIDGITVAGVAAG